MYWCKFKALITIVFSGILLFCLSACRPEIKETKYFDIKGFFKADTAKLNKQKLTVLKAVTINGKTESKKVEIDNWGRELGSFISSDINSVAYKNSYNVIADDDFLLYKAKDDQLKMREMLIKLDKKRVKWILIYNRNKNLLYTTTEKITYYPDSLYLIEKTQRIRLIGTNNYRIEGVIQK
jgi:hypothetical protein